MLELTRQFGESPLPMSTLAQRQGLSSKYLHTLLTALKSAGLVRSIRGPGGGFVLARPPGQIKISETLSALEGPLSLVQCVADRRECSRANRCLARGVWQKLSGAIENVLDGITLQDLAGPEPVGGRKRKRRSARRSGATVRRSGTTARAPRPKVGKR